MLVLVRSSRRGTQGLVILGQTGSLRTYVPSMPSHVPTQGSGSVSSPSYLHCHLEDC